ncbi:MAG TPA: enterochelin esterase [Candidatus Koribacter sp.]|jgi:enterochelin esterase family protein
MASRREFLKQIGAGCMGVAATGPVTSQLMRVSGASMPGMHTQAISKAGLAIADAYDSYCAALQRGDVPSAVSITTQDFAFRFATGELFTKEQRRQQLIDVFHEAKLPRRVTYRILHEEIGDVEATLTVEIAVSQGQEDWAQPGTQTEDFSDDLTEDRWTRTEAGWKMRASTHLRPTTVGSLISDSPALLSPRLTQLAAECRDDRTAPLEKFWNEVSGRGPLIEAVHGDPQSRYVTFLWREHSGATKVSLVGGLPADEPKLLMQLRNTDVWYRTERLPADTRAAYFFEVEGHIPWPQSRNERSTMTDPLNPHCFWFGSIYSEYGSVLELPDAPQQPYLLSRELRQNGRLIKESIHSKVLNDTRSYGVYTPPNHRSDARPYKLVILFDGEMYGNRPDSAVPTRTILDNLTADKKIPETVLLLVDCMSIQLRARDLTCSPAFDRFLVEELLPIIRQRYNISKYPADVVIGGSSFGALAASYSALVHPDVFGNVLSQSGSYWFIPEWRKVADSTYSQQTGWMIERFMQSPRLPVRFYLEVGILESPWMMVATNRHLRDILRLKGHSVRYSEFTGGHDYLTWRGTLADGLVSLLNNSNPGTERPSKTGERS